MPTFQGSDAQRSRMKATSRVASCSQFLIEGFFDRGHRGNT